MCTLAGKSIIDTKKKHADLGRSNKRKTICLNVLSLLVGIGGIIIGSGVFYQYMIDEVILWVIVLCQILFVIAVKLWQCGRFVFETYDGCKFDFQTFKISVS